MKTLPKHYIVDTGLRSWLMGYRDIDMGRVLENTVYLHLLAWGWSVHVGKHYRAEVDFTCNKDGRVVHLQVTDNMFAPETFNREIGSLQAVRDNHEKLIVVRQGEYPADVEGIRIKPARQLLLEGL